MSVYPLDKNRELLKQYTDEEGVIHKIFRLYSPQGEHIDIDVEEKLPPSMRPEPEKRPFLEGEYRRVISEEQLEGGYLYKTVLVDRTDGWHEYRITEKIPSKKEK
ncbi:hypothetical protein QOT17_006377 [Balamuthia mandrillaris]